MPKAEHVSDHQKNLSVQDGQGNAEAIPELTSPDIGAADKEKYFRHRTPPPVFPDSFLGGPVSGLPHISNRSVWMASLFRGYRSYFCLPMTLLIFAFGILLLCTLHQRKWPLASTPRITES
jgi:hypothetical protein